MKCTEAACVHQHLNKCEVNSSVGEQGLCDEYADTTEANEAQQLSFNFGGIDAI